MTQANPILLELYRHRFAGVAEEMGVTLRRTGYSPNIKERLDFSCAVFDGTGRMVAQAAHIPVHLGAMPRSVAAARASISEWLEGDVVILNDPYAGGTHLPDITMISPVFCGPRSPSGPAFFAVSRAHHADVGGMTPGSLPLSSEIFQEGVIIPPVKLVRAGKSNEDLLRLLLRNVRTPDERRGDLAAQRSAHAVAERRLGELVERHGIDEVTAYASHLLEYSERITRASIAEWPEGDFTFRDHIALDYAGESGRADVVVTVRIGDDHVEFDFEGTSEAVAGSFNAVIAITESACYYAVACLACEGAPINQGSFAPVRVSAPEGCLVNARPPHAVAAGNVETSQRVVDAVLGALAQAVPDRIPAASQGTMNNLTIGGARADGTPFAYYETIGGGMGAAPDGDGPSGVHVHMSNTLNTPIEALEMDFPFRIEEYRLRRGSGGAGRFRGGEGIVRTYAFDAPATVTVLSERRDVGPWGLNGGGSGAAGRNLLRRIDGSWDDLPSKFTRRFAPGEALIIETPGGGGWGRQDVGESER